MIELRKLCFRNRKDITEEVVRS